jgi:CBS-domain-containing membrane protein/sporulation protein YlmC with PRC-barrel domain
MTTLTSLASSQQKPPAGAPGAPFRFLFVTELLGRTVHAGGARLGVLTDLVFSAKEQYPEAVGLYLDNGWGRPTTFIPWDRVLQLSPSIEVKPAEGGAYGPFIDQPGWILVDTHLIGCDILDIEGRRLEAVNDVQLVESHNRLALVHVDTSFNGFLRRWGLRFLVREPGRLIGWRYVQPLSVEDAARTDRVALSVTRQQVQELPGEDLADALEELQGKEREALFAALEPAKAAEALAEAEPRVQRHLLQRLPPEVSRAVLGHLSLAQLADLFGALPHDQLSPLSVLLPPETAARVDELLTSHDPTASKLASSDFFTAAPDRRVGDVLAELRGCGRRPGAISYVFVADHERTLLGIVDLRELVLAADASALSEVMTSPVIAAQAGEARVDLEGVFRKYHFRMLPVIDGKDRLLGVIRYNDIMKGQGADARA